MQTDMNALPIETLVIATGNPGKFNEFEELLAPLGIRLAGLQEFTDVQQPDETGETFMLNACIKASGYARQLGEWVIADDSGLEIDALAGAPGVHSARFLSEGSSYDEKMLHIIDKLAGNRERSARFACVIALASPNGAVRVTAEGECRGMIATEARGANGFGYDPIFIPEGFERTFGELEEHEKATVSHRARAADDLIRKMLDFIGL